MKNDYIVRNVYRSFMIVCSMAMVSSTVGAIMLSKALGQGDMDRVRNVFSTAIAFDVVSGVLIIVP